MTTEQILQRQEKEFALINIIKAEANELIAARSRCSTVHKAGNIRAAGNEVEITARKILKRRLGVVYHVGHGHLLYPDGKISPDIDVIVTNALQISSMFETEDKTEYVPVECAYAIGEIKSTYDKNDQPIHKFVEKLEPINKQLIELGRSENTAIFSEVTLDKVFNAHRQSRVVFSFMLFVNSGGFDFDHVEELYKSKEIHNLPNIICLLDKGFIVYAEKHESSSGDGCSLKVSPFPGFSTCKAGNQFEWIFQQYADQEKAMIKSLGLLLCTLMNTLQNYQIYPIDFVSYVLPHL